jgi:TrmH family RNA methyltransferase
VNPVERRILTLARDLKRRKARERSALFVAEGVRTVEELLRAPLAIRGALASGAAASTPRGTALLAALAAKGVEVTEVSEAEFLSAADTEHPQGILAIAAVPPHLLERLALAPNARLLVLDAIQDPGNVGTLVRTAAAMGASAVVALPGTADLWNAKAVRAAAGAHFHVPTLHATVDTLLPFLAARHIPLWGTAADGTPIDAAPPPLTVALAVGNEGAGLGERLRAAAAQMVSLPMSAGVESLNVAVAAGIALYALRP